MSQRDNRGQHRLTLQVSLHRVEEPAVDLHHVQRQDVEGGQRRVPGAETVDAYGRSERAQPGQQPGHSDAREAQGLLGELQPERSRWQRTPVHELFHLDREARSGQLVGGHVHPQSGWANRGSRSHFVPCPCLSHSGP